MGDTSLKEAQGPQLAASLSGIRAFNLLSAVGLFVNLTKPVEPSSGQYF